MTQREKIIRLWMLGNNLEQISQEVGTSILLAKYVVGVFEGREVDHDEIKRS